MVTRSSCATCRSRNLYGLPMTGAADVAIDVTIPQGDHKATGSIDLRCPDGCTLGNDTAKVDPHFGEPGGIEFGHVELAAGWVHIELRDGRATITKWAIESDDVELQASGQVILAERLEDSAIDACIVWAPTEALLERAQKTYAVLSTTGSELQADKRYHVRVTGKLGDVQRRSQNCSI